ncbi:hypothetical protein CPB83DRAFT_944651 [Crepidotus variabilis]|uniref:Heat shock 70 kDa protein 12A n=1 Tax=Crepidotus variabilis TaxID=179855 RepID=A0A9P6E917_9AGAR|nr:hypothetical protein CPB83DRAFT_944651 [Crepidotus variabilis]
MSSRQAYRGPKRKLALAFDVGTTFSGISYSVLDPGQVPEIKPVTRFPAHEHISGASKIPTIIYYDRAGKVKAVGAEALREGILETAEDEEWTKAEWFKLHLRNKIGAGKAVGNDIPALPLNKSVIDVFADFLAYLFVCAETYIKDTHANGPTFWESVKGEIDFVLSHPNGWEGTQQQEMRKAAAQAKLIPDTPAGHARLTFVTEGEASLHYSIQNGLPAGAMKNGDGVVIVDAGGGTIDISSYCRNTAASKETFDEVAAPQCHFHGSVFVSIHARMFLDNFLADSPFHEDLEHIVRCFDKTTKLRFRDSKEFQYVKFGSTRDNDEKFNIRFGQLKLQGSDVAMFFEPSINCVVKAVLDQRKNAHKSISHVVLVGGFAASDWLYTNIQSQLTPKGLNVIRPDNHVNKAVSDGAISFYLDHFVRTRVSKVTYGNFCHIPFEPTAPDHQQRIKNTFVSVSGSKRISDAFDVILPKNTQVTETKEFRKSYFRESENKGDFKSAEFYVWCYRGQLDEPKWKDQDTIGFSWLNRFASPLENYTKLCTITVDLSHLPLQARPKATGRGTFFRLDYEIVLLFGLTELKAQVAWKEKTIEKRSATKIVYDPDTTNDEP